MIHGEVAPPIRVPVGDSLAELRIRLINGHLDLRMFRRAMDDFTAEGLRPTSQAITIPLVYAEMLQDGIRRVVLAADDPMIRSTNGYIISGTDWRAVP
jgi:hypothetical protein